VLARAYAATFRQAAEALGLTDQVSLAQVLQQPNVLKLEEPQVDLPSAEKALEGAVAQAIEQLGAMREKEGLALAKDIGARLDAIEQNVAKVAARAPKVLEAYRARVQARVSELLGTAVDPNRVAQEVALLAERMDVAEEQARLASHLAQFRAMLALDEPVGRKLDFLVQELLREVNTTGSKSQDAETALLIVELKADVERIREQVQNVE